MISKNQARCRGGCQLSAHGADRTQELGLAGFRIVAGDCGKSAAVIGLCMRMVTSGSEVLSIAANAAVQSRQHVHTYECTCGCAKATVRL